MDFWNKQAKWILKAELVKRGISNEILATKLNDFGFKETKSSIDSKISRGTFSAAFFLKCLHVLNCKQLLLESQNPLENSNKLNPEIQN